MENKMFALRFVGNHKVEGTKEKLYVVLQRSETQWEVMTEGCVDIIHCFYEVDPANDVQKIIAANIANEYWDEPRLVLYKIITANSCEMGCVLMDKK